MDIVTGHCPFCAAGVEMRPDAILLITHSGREHLDTYRFFCPLCKQEVIKPATPEVKNLLRVTGIRRKHIQIPKEVNEPHHGAPINWDDVLDFTAELTEIEDLEGRVNP